MKNNRVIKVFLIVIVVYLLCMSVGYAFFSETLTINGLASTDVLYDGDTLPVDIVVLDSSTGRHVIQNGTKTGLSFKSENLQDDTYTLNMAKGFLISGGRSTIEYTIAITNTSNYTMTNGTVSTQIVDAGSTLENASATIDKTTVASGETVYITMRMEANITWRYNTETAKATISYDIGGVTRNFYFIVTYTR